MGVAYKCIDEHGRVFWSIDLYLSDDTPGIDKTIHVYKRMIDFDTLFMVLNAIYGIDVLRVR